MNGWWAAEDQPRGRTDRPSASLPPMCPCLPATWAGVPPHSLFSSGGPGTVLARLSLLGQSPLPCPFPRSLLRRRRSGGARSTTARVLRTSSTWTMWRTCTLWTRPTTATSPTSSTTVWVPAGGRGAGRAGWPPPHPPAVPFLPVRPQPPGVQRLHRQP